MYQCICPQVHLSEFIVCCRVQNNALGYSKCHIPIRRAGMIMGDKYWPQPCEDNYKVRRIWMTYYKVSHIYWNANAQLWWQIKQKIQSDKLSLINKQCVLNLRWNTTSYIHWWRSTCAGCWMEDDRRWLFVISTQTAINDYTKTRN